MNTLKKIIFLSNEKKDSGMGILTLENKNSNIFATLKTFKSNINGDYVLGLKFNDKILKQNISLNGNVYSFIISDKVSLDDNIGCVLLKLENDDISTIIHGSDKSTSYKSKIISTLRNSIRKIQLKNILQSKTNIEHNKYTHKQHNNIKNEVQEPNTNNFHECHGGHNNFINQQPNNVEYCRHGNYTQLSGVDNNIMSAESYSQISLLEEELSSSISKDEIATASIDASLFESNEEEIDTLIDQEMKSETANDELSRFESGKHKFYDMISDQLKELFDRFPREDNLAKLVDNSKWVKINTEIDNKYYVVGIISSNNDIKYICYGVPGSYNIEPPIEMRDYSQWLPTDITNPYSNGYWVMYQDADSGENVFIN